MKILRGYYECVIYSTENSVCDSHTYFLTLEGDQLPLTSKLSIPYNELIEVFVDGNEIIHYNLLVASQRDERLKSIALMRVLGEEQVSTPRHWELTENAARRLEIEYKRLARGSWDVSVTPYVIEGYSGPRNVPYADWASLRRHVDASHNYHHCWGGTMSGICGHATLNGSKAWTFGNCGVDTMIHEQGHNFGLHHTGTPTAEYGELTWMGSGMNRSDFHAAHQSLLGVIDPDSIYQLSANTSKTLFLIDPDSDPQARLPGMWRGVLVPSGFTDTYMISVFKDSIRLHRSTNGRNFSKTVILAQLNEVGDVSMGDERTPGFEFVDKQNGVYQVKVRWDSSQGWPEDADWPSEAPPEDTLPITKDLGGLYHNPNEAGQGLEFYFNIPDRIIGYWYTYHDKGSQVWYYLDRDTIYNVSAGVLDPVGKFNIYVNHDKTLRFSYLINNTRSVIDLDILAYKESGYLAEFEGQPMSGISYSEREGQKFGYIYQLVSERVPGGMRRYQEWLYFNNGKVYKAKGGAFRLDMDYEMSPYGDIEFHDDEIILNGKHIRLNFLLLD